MAELDFSCTLMRRTGMFSASLVYATKDRISEVYYILALHNCHCEHVKNNTSNICIVLEFTPFHN